MLPDEIKNEILIFANIKCHGCLRNCFIKDLQHLIKQGKFYYCSKVCYDFI